MTQIQGCARGSHWLRAIIGGAVFSLLCVVATAQDQFLTPRGNPAGGGYNVQNYNGSQNYNGNLNPSHGSLSEATALLEAAVRQLYKHIEPGEDPSPNELIAYADLRALRLYTGALEVAGWDLEQASQAYAELDSARYRGRIRDLPTDARTMAARERYLAFRETVRTLLLRVRTTAVAVEHQVSFCDPRVTREWRTEVVPTLNDVINATTPLFLEQDTFTAYSAPGARARPVSTAQNGFPSDAVEVARAPVYRPYNGEGRGQGRYFEVRAFGGAVRVKRIRYVSHENSFGVLNSNVTRELDVDQIASPNSPLFVPCLRERFVDLSQLEVEWENADGRRQAFATIDVVGDRPNTANRRDDFNN
jgi:hypothetical protein